MTTTFGYHATGMLTSLTAPGQPAHSFTFTGLDQQAKLKLTGSSVVAAPDLTSRATRGRRSPRQRAVAAQPLHTVRGNRQKSLSSTGKSS